MCGIIGYTGAEQTTPILIDGLKHLEYRGYDSAGLAREEAAGLSVIRSVGKVANLAEKAAKQPADSRCGIAHTRWATHGKAEERNAHPHCDESGHFAVVHNGIIENYREIRRKLEFQGHHFSSDTDSEVIPHLIAEYYSGDLAQAVASALKQLRGTYGIAVIARETPGTIVAARAGSPVIIGIGKHGNFVASDVCALSAHTRNVIYLNDGEIAVLTPEKYEIRTLENVPLSPKVTRISDEERSSGRGKFEHYMLKEIHEQPEAVANTMRGRLNAAAGDAILSGLNLTPIELAEFTQVVIAGCGTSLHAGLVGEYYIEEFAGIPTTVEQAAEFRYRNPIIEPRTLFVPISQSGETADTIAAVREAINKGGVVAALSNVIGSTIARECGRGIYLHAGQEISVASTKAFTCQVVALAMLALKMGRNRRLGIERGQQFVKELQSLPELLQGVLEQAENIRKIAEKYAAYEDFFYIGRGVLYPVALEGALKLKEISYIHAEGCHAAELKHGPISQLGPKAPVIALAGAVAGRDKLFGNIEECRARNSPVIAVVSQDDEAVPAGCSDLIRVPGKGVLTVPLTTVAALQLFAYYYAKIRGCEIDQPRNLAKSVTVE